MVCYYRKKACYILSYCHCRHYFLWRKIRVNSNCTNIAHMVQDTRAIVLRMYTCTLYVLCMTRICPLPLHSQQTMQHQLQVVQHQHMRAIPNQPNRCTFLCQFTFNSKKKMAVLVSLVEPRTYIGCRFASNVGLRFCHRFTKKNVHKQECGCPDPFFINK